MPPRTVQFGWKTGAVLRVGALALVSAALCAGVVFLAFALGGANILGLITGGAGLVFFGGGAILLLWPFLAIRGPVVRLSREGLHDRRVTKAPVPWDTVSNVGLGTGDRAGTIEVKLYPDRLEGIRYTWQGRLIQPALEESSSFYIVTPSLAASDAEVHEACLHFFETARGESGADTV